MTTATRVLDSPVVETGTPPIARGTIEDTGINPWAVLLKAHYEQSVSDHQRSNWQRAAHRILTAPLDRLRDLPLLSNPGRLELGTKPWMATRPAGADGKFMKVSS